MIELVTVCTGNICRSPFSERMLHAELNAVSPGMFSVSSAGTHALVGSVMEPESATLLAGLGGSSEGFVSRQLTAGILGQADLVLALTREHRGAVVRTSPRLLKRAYTLREMARLARAIRRHHPDALPYGDSAEQVQARWAQLGPLLASKRGMYRAEDPADDDVIDPFRRDHRAHELMVEQILPAVEEIAHLEEYFARGANNG
ncbi:MAG: low molecular weight phosphatase family protein [Acidobacteria bacterium]|nr:low molecular weight phosphatase family protein [Acidobacteriota bacterium]